MKAFRALGVWWLWSWLLALVLSSTSTLAQGVDNAELPSNWQSLSAPEFAKALSHLYKPYDDEFLIEVDENVVRQHAAKLYEQIDLSNTALDLQLIDVLHGLAYPELDQSTKKRDLEILTARQDDWTGKPYAAVRAKFSLVMRLGLSEAESGQIVKAWADAGGDLSTIWTEDLLHMREVVSGWTVIGDSCTVTWTGSIQAPVSGNYTFSVPDLRLSARSYQVHERYDLKHSVSLKVNGNQILNSTPESFQHIAAPVQLTAGRPVAIEMVSTFETPDMPKYVAQGILYWSGPGLSETVVAAEYFSGLQLTYHWQQNGEDQEVTQAAANIDNGWPDQVSFGADKTYQASIADVLWNRSMAPDYLARSEQKGEMHPFLAHAEDTLEVLSTAQCTEFLDEALSRPEMLRSLYPKEALDVYRSFRLKNPEAALDLFGLWAQLNADCHCRMPLQYINRMRHFKEFYTFDYYQQRTWRTMAQCVSVHSPTHAARLEAEYLELEDGSCSLPIAQILTYVYMGRGQFDEWVAKLAAKTGDENLNGDQKANWFLAAAQAEEIRLGPHNDIFAIIDPRPMDGIGFLDSALLMAKDVNVKLRVARAKAARYSAVRDFAKAREALDEAERIAPPERMVDIADWRHTIDRFEELEQSREAAQAGESKQAYLATLQRRLDKAAKRGDSIAVGRYNDLLSNAGSD